MSKITKIVEPLLPLQTLDLKIFTVSKKKMLLPKDLLKLEQDMKKTQDELETIKLSIKQYKLDIAKKELMLKETEEKLRSLNVKSNTVKKNDEYLAITNELNSVNTTKGLLEDEILKMYDCVGEKSKTEFAIKLSLEKLEEFARSEKKRVEEEITKLDKELAELSLKRDDIAKHVDKDVLEQYQRVISAKEDRLAIAKVSNYTCQACMGNVTGQDVNLLMQGKELIFCGSCSRILYVDMDEEEV